MATFESPLSMHRFRHLRVSLVMLGVALVAYLMFEPVGGHDGGTWFGYTLGGVCLAVIIWLMWLGVRKRSYFASGWNLKSWVSAHIYWGLALLLLVPLHSGFQFHWNVHTFAYVLTVVVVASGIVGVWLYQRVPAFITKNAPGQKFEAMLQQVADIDSEWRNAARDLPDFVADATQVGIEETWIGGSWLQQLAGRDRRCGTTRALEMMRNGASGLEGEDRERVRELMELVSRKRTLLQRIRRNLRLRTMLALWLFFHVPVSFALMAVVTVHVIVVFYYR